MNWGKAYPTLNDFNDDQTPLPGTAWGSAPADLLDAGRSAARQMLSGKWGKNKDCAITVAGHNDEMVQVVINMVVDPADHLHEDPSRPPPEDSFRLAVNTARG